jgi:hypothetical protein
MRDVACKRPHRRLIRYLVLGRIRRTPLLRRVVLLLGHDEARDLSNRRHLPAGETARHLSRRIQITYTRAANRTTLVASNRISSGSNRGISAFMGTLNQVPDTGAQCVVGTEAEM